jgi:hypothetical protein
MSSSNRSLSKSTFLILFCVCSSLPFVAAKLALEFGWFHAGVNNKGQWLEREIQLLPASAHTQQRWHLVYVQAQACDGYCEIALYTLQQLYIGFGRKQDDVSALIVAAQAPAQLERFVAIKWQAPITSTVTQELQNQIVIVNQQGLVLLRYPVTLDPKGMLVVGKDIRTDLLRLMNYDRVGA